MSGVPGLMGDNVRQREAFAMAFAAWGNDLSELLNGGREADFSPQKFGNQVDGFSEELQLHLEEEIDTLLRLDDCDHVNMKVLGKQIHDAVMSRMTVADSRDSLPVRMLNHDQSYKDSVHGPFPQLPGPLSFLIRRVARYWSAGY